MHSAQYNPFATEYTDSVPYRFEQGDWERNLANLQALNFHAAIVGPKGTGKTTLMEHLAERLSREYGQPNIVHHAMSREPSQRRQLVKALLGSYGAGKILLLDSIERLTFLQRSRLLRLRSSRTNSPGGIIVTVHRSCRLPTWIETRGSMDSVNHVLNHLNELPNHDAIMKNAEAALQTHNGNVRNSLRDLYDQFAEGAFVSEDKNTIRREANLSCESS